MKHTSAIIAILFVGACSGFAPVATRHQHGGHGFSLSSAVDDKTEVREYFNTEGFNRWNKIYSESDDVNSVQLDIRSGHDQTIQKILNWIDSDGDISGKTLCDCGCGVGSLAIPLAQMGKATYSAAGAFSSFKTVRTGKIGGICASLLA
jgi:magnesium-protoporphyrin O-methyltransferase